MQYGHFFIHHSCNWIVYLQFLKKKIIQNGNYLNISIKFLQITVIRCPRKSINALKFGINNIFIENLVFSLPGVTSDYNRST